MNNKSSGKFGNVFNIQRYSLHDGPGIRTVVFLKGCPLRCYWCSNPESQRSYPELAYTPSKCIGCHACFQCKPLCSYGAIDQNEDGTVEVNREVCRNCLECVRSCPSKALHTLGRQMTVLDVIKAAEADSAFYTRSGGGLTISGGEPLMQADFVIEILKEAQKRRIDATIETCGYALWDDVNRVGEKLKTIIYDIKSTDSKKHKQFTGVTNELILDNLIKLRQTFPKLRISVRTPVIPDFNDSEADIGAILDFLNALPNVSYELLPYHRLGRQKYEFLGRAYPMTDTLLNKETMANLNAYVKSRLKN